MLEMLLKLMGLFAVLGVGGWGAGTKPKPSAAVQVIVTETPGGGAARTGGATAGATGGGDSMMS